MGYHWKKTPGGQFVDGHKREDVVHYLMCDLDNAFLTSDITITVHM